MSGNPEPFTTAEVADILRWTMNAGLDEDIADPPDGSGFEMTTPTTGQRFRVTVEEVPGWSDAVQRELDAMLGGQR